MGHRYYDPGTGRFLTRDPIDYQGGENLYGYAGYNPVNENDPSGLDAVILYGGDRHNDAWKGIANSFARMYDDYSRTHKTGQRAHVFAIHGLSDVQHALKTVHSIDTIIYVGHSGIDTHHHSVFYTGSTVANDVKSTDVSRLDASNVDKKVFIFLDGCATAATTDIYSHLSVAHGETSISKAFATKFGTDVVGFIDHVTPGRTPWMGWAYQKPTLFGNFLGDQYFHNGGSSVSPVTVSP